MRKLPELATSDLALLAGCLAVECARRSELAKGDAQWTLQLAADSALTLKSMISRAVREISESERYLSHG